MRLTSYGVAARVNDPVQAVETALGHTFKNKEYLYRALSHRSTGSDNNERLEYLGDSLLGFIIADFLYHIHTDATEGELTRLRASLVKGETLARLARNLQIGEYIGLGASEMKSGGWRRNSILANTMEALIGAIYLDSGMEACRDTVKQLYSELLESSSPATLVKDPKTRLQEYLQAQQKNLPQYDVVREYGEAHKKTFVVKCIIDEMSVSVEADGRSKRIAEQAAAQKVLDIMNL